MKTIYIYLKEIFSLFLSLISVVTSNLKMCFMKEHFFSKNTLLL